MQDDFQMRSAVRRDYEAPHSFSSCSVLPFRSLFERLSQHGQYSSVLRESQFLLDRDQRFQIQYAHLYPGLDLHGPCVRAQILPSA